MFAAVMVVVVVVVAAASFASGSRTVMAQPSLSTWTFGGSRLLL